MATKVTQNRTIVIEIRENEYETFVSDPKKAHQLIKASYTSHPELFPEKMSEGYILNGKTRVSQKLDIQLRKIKLGKINYQIRPSFILPFMREKTDIASKGLFLLRFGVPFWAVAFVLGHNAMWWYRLYLSLGENSLVGTTIKNSEYLPEDVIGDEQHIKVRGKKAYVATTVAENCFLGVEVCDKADEESLIEGYGVFKQEALNLQSDYQVKTVNTDGWAATQKAWSMLFENVSVIECFLHAFLKVRDRATKKLDKYFELAADKIWECYKAENKKSLAQQLRRLKEWAIQFVPESAMKENIIKLCNKKKEWLAHFDQYVG